jgi:ABC-type transport system involved in cytochrome bd biosynthesis fused ATPase/permease subunit
VIYMTITHRTVIPIAVVMSIAMTVTIAIAIAIGHWPAVSIAIGWISVSVAIGWISVSVSVAIGRIGGTDRNARRG